MRTRVLLFTKYLIIFGVQSRETASQVHWDIAKLLEFGVSEKLINQMSQTEIRELLKGIIYLKATHEERLPNVKDSLI